MAKLDGFLSEVNGHFREQEEDSFPWDGTSSSIWYALLVLEDGKIEKYGFTAAKGQKKKLCQALKEIEAKEELMLIGVRTGQYRTDLFILDCEKAINKLEALQ